MSTWWRVSVTFGCGHRVDRYVSLKPVYHTEHRVPWECRECQQLGQAQRELLGVEKTALEGVKQRREYQERGW